MQNQKSTFNNLKSIISLPIRFLLKLPNFILPHRLIKRLSPRNRKIVNLGFITLLLVLIPYFVWTLITPGGSDAAWWNDNWAYRQVATITNSNGSDLTDFQVLVEVDTATLITAGKMKSDCSDVRFTDEGGNILPYWITSTSSGCNTSSTDIWVKVPNVYTSGTNIFLYYGNPGAQSLSNGNQVFTFFDDFSNNNNQWTATAGTLTIANGVADYVGASCQFFYNPNWQVSAPAVLESGIRVMSSSGVNAGYDWPMTGVSSFGANDCGGTSGDWYLYAGFATSNTNTIIYEKEATTYSSRNTVAFSSSTSTWYRWSARNSGAGDISLNVDGTTRATYTDPTPRSNGPGYVAFREGDVEIDWIGFRKYAATDPSISFGSEEVSQGPAAYWAFDEGTGTVANDSTSNKNNGTLQDTPTWIPDSQCIVGSCLQFNGTSEYVSVPNSSSINPTTGLTMTAWVNLTAVASSTNYNIIAKQDWVAELGYRMGFSGYGCSTNCFFMGVGDGEDRTEAMTSKFDFSQTGKWHHVAGVFDSGNLYLYVDGKLVDSTTTPVTSIVNTTQPLTIARHSSGGEFLPGFVDEPKVYMRALSAEQIAMDYNSRGGGGGAVLGATQEESLSQGLVGYWKMDEAEWDGTSGEVIDSSGSNNNGTAVNGADASPSAKFGNAGYFDGVDNEIDIPSNASLDFNSDGQYAVAFWMKPNSIPNGINGTSLMRKSNSGNGISVYMNNNGYVVPVYHGSSNCGNGNCQNQTNTAVPTDAWTHIAVTYNNGESKMYMNGVLKSTLQITGAIDNTSSNVDLSSGNSSCSGFVSCSYPGNLDDFRIYNRELSPQEVSSLYNFAPGPVGYWDFEDGQGSSVTDSSTYGNNGAWVGTGPKWGIGKYGKGGVMNGTDDGVEITAGDSLKPGRKITVEAWVKMDSYRTGSEWSPIVEGAGNLNTNSGYYLGFDTSNALTFYVGVGTAFPVAYTNESAVPLGKWTHIAGVMDDSTISLYVNGALVNSASHSYPSISYTSDPLKFGRLSYYSGAGHDMDGTIDEVRIYNYARTPSQIVQDMNAGHPTGGSPVASQVNYLKFDEGYGTTSGNSGINQSRASLINASWTDDGKFGRAIDLNGSTAYAEVASPQLPTGDFTYSTWIYPKAVNDEAIFMASSGGANDILFYLVSGKLRLYLENAQLSDSTQSIEANKWTYVAVRRSGDAVNYFINGVKDQTNNTLAGALDFGSCQLLIGVDSDSACAGALGNHFFGSIDELKIYNSALTDAQIKLDYNQGSSQVMGSFGLNPDGTASNSAAQTYCVPGDFTTSSCKPIGEWNFEQGLGASVFDTSTNGSTGTWAGSGPKWGVGYVGKGGIFNGTDDYVTMGDASALDIGTEDFTLSAWIKTTSTSQQRIISKRSAGGLGYEMLLLSTGQVDYYIGDAGGFNFGSLQNTAINDGKWHNLTLVFDRDANVTSYIDGVWNDAASISTRNGSLASDVGFYIGRYSVSASQWFNGSIDQARIYNYALSPSQVAWNYNNGKPVAYYDFDECQGSTVHEYYNSGMNGTITIGGSGTQTSVGTCQTAGTAWGNGVNGKYNYSLNFDGTDDYISVADASKLDITGAIALSAWVKPTDVGGEVVLAKRDASQANYQLGIVSGEIQICVGPGAPNCTVSSGAGLTTGAWQHIAVTLDGTTARYYKNGKMVSSNTNASALTANNFALNIGSYGGGLGSFYSGQIDDVQIFNYALTDVQVRNLHNQSSAIRFGPLQGAP